MGLFDVLSKVTGGGDDAGSSGEQGGGVATDRPVDLRPDDFRDRAEALAERSDVSELDFTGSSLSHLDAIATGDHPADDPVAFGSYLGETLVRDFGGEWLKREEWGVAVDVGEDVTTVSVFDAAAMARDGTPVFERVGERVRTGTVPAGDD